MLSSSNILTSTVPDCIYLTGGASSNRHIAQILADVFNCDVFIREGAADSAALGGALRARHCSELHRGEDFFAISKKATSSSKRIAQPNADNVKIYDQMLPIYARLEWEITSASCIS
ncbi:unnamed protein product [Anisakis simplex]|uniref:FGGY_C domain-containing protein n=1 Tax=Anisakis simplex TaxID=6269 RepID=A0A0M3JZI7_ANISI|nr:unnamed protein product [Anisakis simplex]